MSLEEADRIMGLSSLLFRGFQDFLAAAATFATVQEGHFIRTGRAGQ